MTCSALDYSLCCNPGDLERELQGDSDQVKEAKKKEDQHWGMLEGKDFFQRWDGTETSIINYVLFPAFELYL